jgi:hypothetical protein
MPNDKTKSKPENVTQQETGGDCVSRLVVHLLKYGGCWIVGLTIYAFLFWVVPWKFFDSAWGIPMFHGAFGLFVWTLYGAGGLDGDP